jgi:hypothetical protein
MWGGQGFPPDKTVNVTAMDIVGYSSDEPEIEGLSHAAFLAWTLFDCALADVRSSNIP